MTEVRSSHTPIHFGVFELNPESGELRKQGFKIKLQEQPFQVLKILLEHPGKVVTREELRQRIWPSDTFVDFDQGLYNATKKLREALGDTADSPRYIETLPRRGYRFIGSAIVNANAALPEEMPTNRADTLARRGPRAGLLLRVGAATLLVGLVGLTSAKLWQWLSEKRAVPLIRSIAVLPLENLSTDPTQEYFSDGLTDALITDLAQIGSLKVISRTSSMQYKQTRKSLPEIARELNVDGIIEGTVQRSGDRVRITAQLVHGRSDKHLWAKSYERDLRDVLTLERELTQEIVLQIQAQLTTTENQTPPVQPRPVNPKALDAYLEGTYHLNKASMGTRDEELRKAGEYFQHALDAEPAFAPAYIGLTGAHHDLFWPSSTDFTIMRASAEKAVELAPNSSDAHGAVALTKYEDWDWIGAEQEYRRAIALNPNNASAHDRLGGCLDDVGRMDEAWKEYEIAQELDPSGDHLSWALYLGGQYDRAIELLRKKAELGPEDSGTHWRLSESYGRKGLFTDWVQELGKTMTTIGFPEIAARLHRAFALSGYSGALQQWAGELERLAANKKAYFPGILAEDYALLGDKNRAFYWLDQGCEHHHMAISDPVLTDVKVDPAFASLRSDPRFKDLLRRMGLPP
jgi:TolB-like protein/DNA-binding winged helix-turn-helix (wHTH) protein